MYKIYDNKHKKWLTGQDIFISLNDNLYECKLSIFNFAKLHLLNRNRYEMFRDTGMFDATHKLIYEGDICTLYGEYYIIKYDERLGRYVLFNPIIIKYVDITEENISNIFSVGHTKDNLKTFNNLKNSW